MATVIPTETVQASVQQMATSGEQTVASFRSIANTYANQAAGAGGLDTSAGRALMQKSNEIQNEANKLVAVQNEKKQSMSGFMNASVDLDNQQQSISQSIPV